MDSKNSNSILIVDDSSTNLVLLEAILQEEGYKTYTALNAKEAYASIEKYKPDIILLDLLMPQVSGFDILEKLKAFPSTSEIPVIVVSAVNTKENIDLCRDLGAADFFSKPIEIPLFLSRLRDFIF
ncbi:MAG: response regulator [Bacteroidales bacterium]|nr:MAG: response regulator [Bacteroidales bacterium]